MTENIVIPPEKMVFIPLGGATGVGMNFFLYGYRGKWLIVDCGIGFPGDHLPGVDVLLPNPEFIRSRKKDIVGLIVTHAHEDHIGAIPYLWPDLQCPVFCTPFANELLCSKLNEYGLLGRVNVNIVNSGMTIDLSPFEIEFVAMNHSVPEPNALAIRTQEGLVVHTGDWKLGRDAVLGRETDMVTLEKLGKEGVLALVCDSTSVFADSTDKTEEDVRATIERLIGQYPGKQIAVACFASNVARVESIYHAAVANGRDVCLLGRSLWRIDAAARATGYFKGIPEFLSEEEALDRPVGSVLYICTGSQGEPRSALNTLSAMTPSKNGVYLEPDDVVIFSSRVIPGNEESISFLQRRLKTKGLKVITDREELVHVSGHYAGPDLERMYTALKPKIALPVHGEAQELMAHVDLAKKWGVENAFALEDGEVITLDETPQILGEVPAGVLAVDGKQILRLDAEVLKKRRKMMDDGTLVLTLVMDKKGHIMGAPQISTFGLLDSREADQKKLLDIIVRRMTEAPASQKSDNAALEQVIRTEIRQFLGRFYGKKPLIEIHLIRI
ncbi:MAG: ribonuclease J [Alphaproteobacteria bacterium]|nr:ribonuclease J [Alphaproteobacteria bacterium]